MPLHGGAEVLRLQVCEQQRDGPRRDLVLELRVAREMLGEARRLRNPRNLRKGADALRPCLFNHRPIAAAVVGCGWTPFADGYTSKLSSKR